MTKADARVKELEGELSSLLYSVSHDVRAPLRTIIGFAEALAEDYGQTLDPTAADYLKRIREAAARMELLLGRLLELSRVGRDELKREQVDITSIAQSIADSLRASDQSRHVTFAIQQGLKAEGDPRLLRIALEHLLNNAWKFTSKHPKATITVGKAERNGRQVLFVQDDGAGFDPAYAGKLFGAFQRLHAATEFDGVGTGLAMVKRIVARHGGEVWAEGKVEEGVTVNIAGLIRE